MRTTRLLSTIAATALLGAGAAAAQDTKGSVMPERPPAAQQNAPAEKIAPPMNAGERGSAGTTGQGSAERLQPGSGGSADLDQRGTVGASPQGDDNSGAKAGVKADADAKGETGSQKSGSTGLKSESDSNAQAGAGQDSSSPSTRSTTEESGQGQASKSDTTGQGAAAGAAKLTTEQRTRITSVIREQNVEPAKLDVSVHVGAHIPANVQYHPLPVEVVEIYPEWRGYYYILVSDRIVIIEPDTRAVVFIIEA